IIPDPDKKMAPFYPDQRVEVPYGGANYQHLDALVATPTALARFMNNLAAVYTGQGTGPLQPLSVLQMLQMPPSGSDEGSNGWFGLGLEVFPDMTEPANLAKATWSKGGDEPGTLTSLKRFPDGSIIALTFNLDATKEKTIQNQLDPAGLPLDVQQFI